jgi:hypothetical protein
LTHGEIEIIRSDNAAEFARAADWFAYLVDSGIVGEYSVAYEHHQVGAVERGWGIILAIARTLLAQAGFSMSHWYSACVHGCTLAGFVTSDVVNVDGDRLANSAFYRFWRYEPDLRLLRCYGSPMRYYLDPTQRDHKLGLTGEAGYYVGISPENHQAIWVWNGSRYLTVSGSCVIDETRFLEPLAAHATHLPHWPNPASDNNNSRRFHLLARAHHETTAGRLNLAAAITEAADVAHCGDFEYDPDDILRHQKTHGMTQHAALHSMECISGRQKFDELNIHELQQAHGVYRRTPPLTRPDVVPSRYM